MPNEDKNCNICGGNVCNCNESDQYELTWAGLQEDPEHFGYEEEDC